VATIPVGFSGNVAIIEISTLVQDAVYDGIGRRGDTVSEWL